MAKSKQTTPVVGGLDPGVLAQLEANPLTIAQRRHFRAPCLGIVVHRAEPDHSEGPLPKSMRV